LNNKNWFNRRGCLVIQKTMAMTNIKFDHHFFIIAITQKLLAGFYLNFYPVVVMKFFISHYFFSSSPPSVKELVPPGTCPAWPRSPLLHIKYTWKYKFLYCMVYYLHLCTINLFILRSKSITYKFYILVIILDNFKDNVDTMQRR
jgi:hypothetical protein